jgi:hypothetical protein
MQSRNLLVLLLSSLFLFGLAGSSLAQLPDRDGDGVPDSRDSCMSNAGTASNNGCPDNGRATDVPPPDTDGDGTADPLDRCPNEAGDGANGGCPPGTTEGSPASTPEMSIAAAPTTGDCVLSSLGSNPVNIRQFPNVDAEIVGIISPNEWLKVLARFDYGNLLFSQNDMGDEVPFNIFPFDNNPPDQNYVVWFLVKDSDSDATGWVAEAVIRMGGDCADFVIENPAPDAVYMEYKLEDLIISSAEGSGTSDDSHREQIEIASFTFGEGSAVPVFPNENPFFWIGLDPQEASTDFFLKIDGVEGESSDGDALPMEEVSLNYARVGEACDLVENSDGTIEPVCDDGGTPPSIIVCSYQQLTEAGVYEEVCYEVEIPEGCVVDSSEAGLWHIICEDDGDGVQVTPVGETAPILDIKWEGNSVQIGLLLPAVQKVREAAAR